MKTSQLLIFSLTLSLAAMTATPAWAGTPRPASASPAAPASVAGRDHVAVMIELADEPSAVTWAAALRQAMAAQGGARLQSAATLQAARLQAATAARAQLQRIGQAQGAAIAAARRRVPATEVLYQVQRAYNGIAVYVPPGEIESLRTLPGVKAVHRMIPKVPTNDTSVPFIGAHSFWAANPALTGQGVRIGIIDTGIDYLHTDFGGPGTGYATNDTTRIGDTSAFPGPRVVGGYDFAGDAYNGSNTPHPDPDPMDGQEHGTHVAGTAAGCGVLADGSTYTGPYDNSVNPSMFRIGPGVAPGAQIYALRVFGKSGSTNLADKALDWATDPNQDGDFSDHLDVVNLSLGSDYGSPTDTTTIAANNAASLGVIVVASAGNSGDMYYITGSPAMARKAISVASSLDGGLFFYQMKLNAPSSLAGLYKMVPADFGPVLNETGVTGNVVYANPPLATGPLTNGSAISGNIALIDRGTNSFVDKVKNAQAAGAIAVIMVNNTDSEPITMGGDDETITIPSVMISKADGLKIKNALGSSTVNATVALGSLLYRTEEADMISDFSSRGPSCEGAALKPDLAAPGQDITSAWARSGDDSTIMSGTSMASPHVAGAMALLCQLHPDWNVEQLKALVMNTATNDIFENKNQTDPRFGLGRIGAGRINLANALLSGAVAYVDDDPGAVSVSFGAIEVVGSLTLTKTVRVTNATASAIQYTLDYDPRTDVPGVDFSLPGGASLTVPAKGSATFTIRLQAQAAQMKHTHDPTIALIFDDTARHFLSEESGYVRLTPASGPVLRVPVYAAPRHAAQMSVTPKTLALPDSAGVLPLKLQGTGLNTGSSYPTDEESLVEPFDLQYAASGPAPEGAVGLHAKIKYAGVRRRLYEGTEADVGKMEVLFGIATEADWTSPNYVSFTVDIDRNKDGAADYYVFNGYSSLGEDVFVSVYKTAGSSDNGYYRYMLNYYDAGARDTYPMNTNVMELRVLASDIGPTQAVSSFNYRITTYSNDSSDEIDETPWLAYDLLAPAFTFDGDAVSDQPGQMIQCSYDRERFNAEPSRGILLLHYQNTRGSRAEAITLAGKNAARNWMLFE